MYACVHVYGRLVPPTSFFSVRSQNHSKYDSFACVILSHGAEGIVYASDGTINVDRLIGYFRSDRCPTLAGKPKMFFIQVRFSGTGVAVGSDLCRGNFLEEV